jgi:hypothetical protein
MSDKARQTLEMLARLRAEVEAETKQRRLCVDCGELPQEIDGRCVRCDMCTSGAKG